MAGVTTMLSLDFVKLIIVAMLIALPLSDFLMQHLLQDFAYQIRISWWIYFAAGFSALFIALATVRFEAVKAALANPVKSLKAE